MFCFCESEIGYLGILFVCFLLVCVRKGSIRDEIHLKLNVLNGLEISHKVLSHSLHTVGKQYMRNVRE